MTDMQNFIEIPSGTPTFRVRMEASFQTVHKFFVDQKWISIGFLFFYVVVMIWDAWYAGPIEVSAQDKFWEYVPAIFQSKFQGTWRGLFASLVTLLYWGNALLYIADRSEAFKKQDVVGLVRYLLRGTGIILLLGIPLVIGFGLLFLPGLLVLSIILSGATISLFRNQTVFRAIGTGYRLATQSPLGQSRVLGFSRNLFHIAGGYGLVLLATLVFMVGVSLVVAGLEQVFPGKMLVFEYTDAIISNVFSSYLSLVFSISILRLYAEHVGSERA